MILTRPVRVSPLLSTVAWVDTNLDSAAAAADWWPQRPLPPDRTQREAPVQGKLVEIIAALGTVCRTWSRLVLIAQPRGVLIVNDSATSPQLGNVIAVLAAGTHGRGCIAAFGRRAPHGMRDKMYERTFRVFGEDGATVGRSAVSVQRAGGCGITTVARPWRSIRAYGSSRRPRMRLTCCIY